MISEHRKRAAERRGEKVVHDCEIESLPVNPFCIAKSYDIPVRRMPDSESGVSGMLLRHGNSFGIAYSTHVNNEGFQRFSIGHELGHYFLDGHLDIIPFDAGRHRSKAGFGSGLDYELEADHFSSGLLMPSILTRRAFDCAGQGMDAIEAVAKRCITSFTATAIRYANLTDDAVAIIVSQDNAINYAFLSRTMKSLPQITWPSKGHPVPSGTVTANLIGAKDSPAGHVREEGECDISDWLGVELSEEAFEQAVKLGSYGKILTVITCPSLIEQSFRDEDEDRSLEDQWRLRF